MTIETRRQAHRLGHSAEWRAVWRLRLAGYSIRLYYPDGLFGKDDECEDQNWER